MPAAALLLAGSLAAIVLLGPDRAHLPYALLPWGLAYGALIRLWLRDREWLGRPGVLIGGAVALRALFLTTFPDLSDDLYRYVWDGLLTLDGIRPYALVPSDPALSYLQDSELFRQMNSPDYHSIYPPLSQWVFAAGAAVHRLAGWPASAFTVQAGMTLMELGGVLFAYRALRRSGRPTADLALYAWNPLVLVVIAGGGHTEGGLVLGLGLLLWGISTRRPFATFAGLALAVLAKGLPILLLPLAWRATGRRAIPAVAWVAAGAVLLSIPFLRPGDLPGVLSSARLYTELFEFNAPPPYALLGTLLPGATWLGTGLALAGVAGAGWVSFRHPADTAEDVARAGLLIFTILLLTATTVHPWYLIWVLVFLPWTRSLRPAWIWASGAAILTYLTYLGVPHMPIVFWSGWAVLALHGERERVLRPLRHRAARRKAGWVQPWLTGRVVDIGGAEGGLARELSPVPIVLDPMDIPPDLVRIRALGESLPLADDSVDSVLLSFVLHHAQDPDRILAETLRVARRRVVILESTPRTRWGAALLRPLDAWVNSGRGDGRMKGPIHYRPTRGWVEAAEKAGARVLRADRPNRFGHPVTRLVLEVSGQTGDASR